MEVRFTKLGDRRYLMKVTRERGAPLAEIPGPGYDDDLPHDAVHFIVEAEAGIAGGAFGRVAAGGSGIFPPADRATQRKTSRHEKKRPPSKEQGADMARSERLVGMCTLLWELRSGRRHELPPSYGIYSAAEPSSPMLDRIVDRLDAFAQEWRPLPVGGSITLTWPQR